MVGLSAIGCGAEEDMESVSSYVVSENALTANALTANALTANALTANALTANALTANALTANALTANALKDPLARELLKYVVSCALDEDDTITVKIDGVKYKFPGSLGLAEEWGERDGKCDMDCQRWVTACVLSRVDVEGIERMISIRGDNKALKLTAHEKKDYPVREATYFGNLFVDGKPRYLCLSPGQQSDQRVCGSSMSNCPMTVVGDCDDACQGEGPHGDFRKCSNVGKAGRGETFAESITVFLPK
jgi:hypothetical protein